MTVVASAAIRARAPIGVQLNVPIYQGGFVDSRVREAIALQDKSRQDLEGARRAALFAAQTGFAGVNSAAASVKAFEQAVVSAESRARSRTSLGQEVGVRTILDVLNVQQNVYSTRRDLAQCLLQVPDRRAAAQGRGRRADRAGHRRSQSPAEGLTARRDRGSARGDGRVDARREPCHEPVGGAAMRGVERERGIAHRARGAAHRSSSAATVATSACGIGDLDAPRRPRAPSRSPRRN